ncbi:MAG: hypothetical protein U5K43_02340 [Halofilum sp. (in: g-proteobacteria)]|nr:hypothetical protein [Halofilum sp. (in: g-proteobacteria)]
MSRTLRIAVLLVVLAFVALSAWTSRLRLSGWERTHWVAVYPINAEGTAAVDAYIDGLRAADLEPLERWFGRWATHHDATIERPFDFHLAPRVADAPPPPPQRGELLATMLWSLRMRWWAWRHDTFEGPASLQVFVAYHDPEQRRRVAHSLGLRKGGIGVVNGFGAPAYAGRNNVVIAHELLHLVGASDKYDPETGRPIHPQGYADPGRRPLLPQRRAEIMGATIPLGPRETVMPPTLADAVVGPATAREIGWSGG